MTDATREFCERLAAITGTQLPAKALALSRQLVLDGIAIAVAGTAERAIRLFAEYHREQGGVEAATVLGLGFNGLSALCPNFNL